MNNIPERYLNTKKIIFEPDEPGDRIQVLLDILRGNTGPPLDLRAEETYHLISGAWDAASEIEKQELEKLISEAVDIANVKKEHDILGYLLCLASSLSLKNLDTKNAIIKLVKDPRLKKKKMREHSLHYWSLKTAASLDLANDLKEEFISDLEDPETCHIAYESLLYLSADDAKKYYFNYRQTMDHKYPDLIEAEELKSLTLWNIEDKFGEKTLEEILADFRDKTREPSENPVPLLGIHVVITKLSTIQEQLEEFIKSLFILPHPVKIKENKKAQTLGIRPSIV